MAKVNYVLMENDENMKKLIRSKIVSAVMCGSSDLIVARYGVNKKTLIKISKQVFGEGK